MATEGTPLMRYYSSFAKAKEEETRRRVAKTEEISEGYDFIPKLNKKKEKAAKKKDKEPKEFKGIFGGEDDDDSSDSEMVREMMETMHPACNRFMIGSKFYLDSGSDTYWYVNLISLVTVLGN